MSNSLAKNSIFNVCYQLLNVIFPLISASYVARVLMPSGVGLVAMAQNWDFRISGYPQLRDT